MITGEIKVNEYLTLLKWQATNEGDDPLNPKAALYNVRVNGIYGGHHPFVDEFELTYERNTNHLGLVIKIHQAIAERTAEGLTRRPPVE